MKKLVAITALGLSLGFSALTFAADRMDLYVNGPSATEVKSETRGGELERSPMSFYLRPIKEQSNGALSTAGEKGYEENALYVFGVRI